MKAKIYFDNEKFIAGMTIKDGSELEYNNMALHACITPNHIVANRKKLAAFLHCNLIDFVCVNQTHSSNFQRVTLADKGRGADRVETAIKDTDAIYTYESNLILCCFTADCVPVIFYDETTGLIGVIHSGWQGTVNKITSKVLEYLIQFEHCFSSDLHVYIGMALSQKKFEVNKDVYFKFRDLGYTDNFIYYNDQTRKYHIDNQKIVKKQCELAGIPAHQITIDQACTYLDPDGFSYRQDKQCGRHLSFIMKKDRD